MPESVSAPTALHVQRRQVLLFFALVAADAILPASRAGAYQSLSSVLEPLGSASIRDPELTGDLPDPTLAGLWRMFKHIGDNWANGAHVALDEGEFAGILRLKASEIPSYLTEYNEASAVLMEFDAAFGDPAEALRVLFTPPASPAPDFHSTRLGHAQTYVVAEFINLQIAYGGFHAFGYVNYPGWPGGPFADLVHIPYRSWP